MNYKLVTWKIKSRKTHKKKKRKISEKSRNRNVPKIYELCVTNRKIRWKNKENLKPIKKGRKIESKKKKEKSKNNGKDNFHLLWADLPSRSHNP